MFSRKLNYNNTYIRWFTLIEIVVVLLVVMILLWIILRSSSNFASHLEFKNQKEEFVWHFNHVVMTAMSSNHNAQWSFTGITMELWTDYFSYTDTNIHRYTWSKIKFSHMKIDNQIVEKIWLQLIPYQLGCISLPVWSSAFFEISYDDVSTTCFRIDLSVCKLSEISCPNTPNT